MTLILCEPKDVKAAAYGSRLSELGARVVFAEPDTVTVLECEEVVISGDLPNVAELAAAYRANGVHVTILGATANASDVEEHDSASPETDS